MIGSDLIHCEENQVQYFELMAMVPNKPEKYVLTITYITQNMGLNYVPGIS